MTPNYPDSFDDEKSLLTARDGLRVMLADDYTAGDTSIAVSGDPLIIAKFPATGLITITEQCSEVSLRAISFSYASRTASTFDGLTVLEGFVDSGKSRGASVTQGVMAQYHNILKDAIIALQDEIGVLSDTTNHPGDGSITARLEMLERNVLRPRAWFTAEPRTGLVPLTITVQDQSFRVGDEDVTYIWDFGDEGGISEISGSISVTDTVPDTSKNVLVYDTDGGTLTKKYTDPGLYDVSLTVRNKFGEDTVVFENLINVRYPAPEEAIIDIAPRTNQTLTEGTPVGGPYTTPPVLRTPANTEINIEIPLGENPFTPGQTYAGEQIVAGEVVDPIVQYTWNLNDDLTHSNATSTRAIYSVGGYYDIRCRVDTRFGSFRITTYPNSIDVVEAKNLWMWVLPSGSISGATTAYEMGLISETFKNPGTAFTVSRDNSFLDYLSATSYNEDAEARAKREFQKNTHFCQAGTTQSGAGGLSSLYWASGGSGLSGQSIVNKNFNGFNGTYISNADIANRPWNWVAFSSPTTTYFAFGGTEPESGNNPSHAELLSYHLATSTASTVTMGTTFFSNGAEELLTHPSSYGGGVATNGEFAVYRSCWQGRVGYILRNTAVNEFFRLASFYATDGNIVTPVTKITKLSDAQGATKTEGQLVPLADGIFLFSNSGEFSVYNPRTGSWLIGNASSSSVSFRSMQDASVSGFDDPANTLHAASDGNEVAYLSYDYSTSAFIKYSARTFSVVGRRPTGDQFLMGVY